VGQSAGNGFKWARHHKRKIVYIQLGTMITWVLPMGLSCLAVGDPPSGAVASPASRDIEDVK
jgi:hypothetical protein